MNEFRSHGVFGAMGPGLFGFGVSLAIEREQGLLRLKQALPELCRFGHDGLGAPDERIVLDGS